MGILTGAAIFMAQGLVYENLPAGYSCAVEIHELQCCQCIAPTCKPLSSPSHHLLCLCLLVEHLKLGELHGLSMIKL